MSKNTLPCETLANAAYLDLASARCKARGTQLTPIRKDVLSVLYETENGLKAYDLLAKIKERRSNATPPTVYRALDFLMEQGLVHKIERINQFLACRHESHPFPGLLMLCRHCGKVTELHDQALMNRLIQYLGDAGYQMDCSEIEIASLCPNCH
jgi:Fur family zinc uptake transcriptional regulator